VDAFALGRAPATLHAPYQGDGNLFAGQLADDAVIQDPEFANSTFANVSFLRAKVTGGTFRNCVFMECYFRKAEFRETSFVGCKFINCNFTHVSVRDCDFRYAEFRGSAPPFQETLHSAPQQANLRYELFDGLARAAHSAGHAAEARRYKVASIDALDLHLRAAVRGDSAWYREHYDVVGRVQAALRLGWHRVNRLLWGHGESAWRLLSSAAIATLLIFPILFLALQSGVRLPEEQAAASDYLWLSLSNFLLLDRISDAELTTWSTQTLASIEALLGVIFAGMYVTLLVKALLRR
jgi:hypothetical protein